jgi:heavy metal translocating P-type ATPase
MTSSSSASTRAATSSILPLFSLTALAAGGILHAAGDAGAGDAVWAASIVVLLIPLAFSVVRSLAHGDLGVDVIALIAMATALALGSYLAGAVVGLMMSGGNALEAYAAGRARRELTALLERAPRVAHRRVGDSLEEVPIEAVVPGDVVVVRAGEVVPVDGTVAVAEAVLDESALTGEPLPVTHRRGEEIRSGTANAGDAFELRATRRAADSAYAALVDLVRSAETERAPFVRMADRYAAIFLPLTLVTAGIGWALGGDPERALAVLVVATPCPLILAAPIALVAGISRCARAGVIVKGGTAIEALGGARTVLLDKTGTLTLGAPAVEAVVPTNGNQPAELLRLAASVDQLSAHVLGAALARGAHERGLALSMPGDVVESPGSGIAGTVDGHAVAVGSSAWLRDRGYDGAPPPMEAHEPGKARVLVGVDGRLAGAVVMGDRLRDDARELIDRLREAGVRQVAMVTGDEAAPAQAVAREAGIDRVYADCSPEEKLEVVKAVRRSPDLRPVVMVGDGVNDAPALALADVGVAMAAAGATVSSETADAVIADDRVDRVADAIRIGHRALAIARQSVLAGIGLSLVAMGFAAAGYIPPVAGALLQEGIDVAVILNALRALRVGS